MSYSSLRKILSRCRIEETIFTSLAVIGGKLFSNQTKNINHVHRDIKDLVFVIINLVNNISGGYTVFYDRVKISDLGDRAHVLKHLHGRMVFDSFEKFFDEGSLWRGHIAVISLILTKQIFVHFYCHGVFFNKQYINKTIKTKYLDDNDSRVKPFFFHKCRNNIFIWLHFKR